MLKPLIVIFIMCASLRAQNNSNTLNIYNSSNSPLSVHGAACIAIDSQQVKWMSSEGLLRFDGVSWKVFNSSNSPISHNISSIAIDKNNVKWISTMGGGLFELKDSTWTNYKYPNPAFPVITVLHVSIDKYNNKWISTAGVGLIKFDDNVFTIYNTTNSGLPHDIVNFTAFDRENNIWVGTENGLAKFDCHNTWTVYNTANSGINSNTIARIAVDSLNVKWVSTDSRFRDEIGPKGLNSFDDTEWIVYGPSNSPLPEWVTITSIYVDKNNVKWFATGDANWLYKLAGSIWTNYGYNEIPFPSNALYHINFDKYENMWICVWGGVVQYNPKGIVGINNNTSNVVKGFELSQNYPNPFNGTSIISYKIGKASIVEISVYDILGKKLRTLVNGFQKAGTYQEKISSNDFSSGVYFYTLKTNEFSDTKKFVIIR